jgi:hypothetical protein
MEEQLTAEEKKVKADAHDALIKHVFDNVRNVLICTTFAVSGVAVLKYSAGLAFGSEFNTAIGLLVFVSAFGLCVWNMLHGVEKLIRPIKGTRKAWLMVPFAIVYMLSVFAVFQAWSRALAEPMNRSVPTTVNNQR